MYIVFGNKILDTKEIGENIEENTEFKVLKDMSKGTKREDVCAYNLSIPVELLNEEIDSSYNIEELDEDTLFEEYMASAEEIAMEIEEFLPEESKIRFVTYKWDLSDNDVRGILVVGNDEITENKMMDVLKRLLTQVE
ncbi:hypothetical protein K5V21_08355 [Clostridium sardiniense]|uniref:Uncharacterized protein n=1 Tax=Clostridium sardiniense TaxID=29369 RepID=A0ABS7KY25_CLOSR|nr:hypothetical protein [Clostridium sardiniense]MBM7835530.1 hypothetical protein [Clostridium sardiniense]MBY0755467.1 hypothetical protein [Clostridium sardiniense]MDQ0461542.1 hypothetical protein [Clostridium sardiniense]